MEPGEQFAREAEQLRTYAAALRRLKVPVGTLLDDHAAKAAAPGVWKGPAAEALTTRIRLSRDSLHRLAQDIEATARRWDDAAAMREANAKAIRDALDRIEREGAPR